MSVRRICMICGVIALGGLLLILVPATAQDTPPALATNTPAAPPSLATNTPASSPPDAPFDRYALRLWTESALVDVLLEQIRALAPGDAERQLAIRLLQVELQQRFPGAPHNRERRLQLLSAMLAAPRGSVDMRLTVRAFVQEALNDSRPAFDGVRSLDVSGFNITITPANVDGRAATQDAVLHTRYPAAGDALYDDFLVAQQAQDGTYQVLASVPSLPVGPLQDVIAVNLERLGDVNQDGADELSLSVDTGGVNRELMIYGWRGGTMVNLVLPGERILFGEIVEWPLQGGTLTTRVYRVESEAWRCLGQRVVDWQWRLNYFRVPDEVDDYTFQNRVSCLLYGSEPVYEKPVSQAVSGLEAILQFAQPDDEASVQRANMMLAMLNMLDGNVEAAVQKAQQLQAQAQPGSWLAQQTTAFLDAAAQPVATPIRVCAALEHASTNGACSVEAVLTRLFSEQPLRRDTPIEAQLAALGINVLDKQTITAVGKRDRQAFRFDLTGDRWWAFAPLQADVYTAEKIGPLPGFGPLPTARPEIVRAPTSAFNSLLLDNNPTATLNILDNAVRDNPGVPLASSARLLQALSYDLLADRNHARRAYFALWAEDPTSLWGQLAAAHLDKR